MHEPFCVIATQNPIEQEGTYPLPEAQQDRFMALSFVLDYPSKKEEIEISPPDDPWDHWPTSSEVFELRAISSAIQDTW